MTIRDDDNICHGYKKGIDYASKHIQVISPFSTISDAPNVHVDKLGLSMTECTHRVCSDISNLEREVGGSPP